MDEGLFLKHIRTIKEASSLQQQCIDDIYTTTGILINSNEIVVFKKKITLQVSSVKRSSLIQKGIQEYCSSKGLSLTL